MVDGDEPARPAISMEIVELAGISSSPLVVSPAPPRARSLKKALAVVDELWTVTAVKSRSAARAEPVFESVKSSEERSVQSVEALLDVSTEAI